MHIYKTAVDEAREALAQAAVLIDSAIETIEEIGDQDEPTEAESTAGTDAPEEETPEAVVVEAPPEPAVEQAAPEGGVTPESVPETVTPAADTATVSAPVATDANPAEAPAETAVPGDVPPPAA